MARGYRDPNISETASESTTRLSDVCLNFAPDATNLLQLDINNSEKNKSPLSLRGKAERLNYCIS